MGQYDQVLSEGFLKNINPIAIGLIINGRWQTKLKLDSTYINN